MENVAGSNGWHEGIRPLLSPLYMTQAVSSCLRLFMHAIFCAFALADESAGNNIAARIAMMATTTSNSINVNARGFFIDGIFSLMKLTWIFQMVSCPRPAWV